MPSMKERIKIIHFHCSANHFRGDCMDFMQTIKLQCIIVYNCISIDFLLCLFQFKNSLIPNTFTSDRMPFVYVLCFRHECEFNAASKWNPKIEIEHTWIDSAKLPHIKTYIVYCKARTFILVCIAHLKSIVTLYFHMQINVRIKYQVHNAPPWNSRQVNSDDN